MGPLVVSQGGVSSVRSRRSSRTTLSSARKGKTSSSSSSTLAKYSFPLLSVKEILLCLHELEMEISAEEIMDCGKHRTKIRYIVEALMEMCFGVSRKEVSQKVFHQFQNNQKDDYISAVIEVRLFREAQSMMFTCGVHDYGLEDWLAPEPKRLRRNLSAVINFAKFREEELVAYTELCQKRDTQSVQINSAQEELSQLQHRVADLEDSTAHHRSQARTAQHNAIDLEAKSADLQHATRQAETRRQRFESVQTKASHQCRLLEDAALKAHKERALGTEHYDHTTQTDQLLSSTATIKLNPIEQTLQDNRHLALEAKEQREAAHKAEAAVLAATAAIRQIQATVPELSDALSMLDNIEKHLAKHKDSLLDLKHVNSENKRLLLALEDSKTATVSARNSAQAYERRVLSAQQDTQKLKHNTLLAALHQDLETLEVSLKETQNQFKELSEANEALYQADTHHQQQILARHTEIANAANELTKHINDTMLLREDMTQKPTKKTNFLGLLLQAAVEEEEDEHRLGEHLDFEGHPTCWPKQTETSPILPTIPVPLAPITNIILPPPSTPSRSNFGFTDDVDDSIGDVVLRRTSPTSAAV